MSWRDCVAKIQIESVRKDLKSALAGKNSYGGDTAEIYAFRVQMRNPTAETALRTPGDPTGWMREALIEMQTYAAQALAGICSEFQREKKCLVELEYGPEWLSPKDWLKRIGYCFSHRVHVRVTRR